MLELRRMREFSPIFVIPYGVLFLEWYKELTLRQHRMVTLIVADYLGFITK
jgi:hypothetical protein